MIYVPTYTSVLESQLKDIVEELISIARGTQDEPGQKLCLVDYFTNGDINVDSPLSHAALLKQHMIRIHEEAGGTYEGDEEEKKTPAKKKKKKRKSTSIVSSSSSSSIQSPGGLLSTNNNGEPVEQGSKKKRRLNSKSTIISRQSYL